MGADVSAVTTSKLRFALGAPLIALVIALVGATGSRAAPTDESTGLAAFDEVPCGTYANATSVQIPPPLPSLRLSPAGVTGAASSIEVTGAGSPVDAVAVTIPELDYPAGLEHVSLTLIAPNGDQVALVDRGAISGTSLLGTVLDDAAASPLDEHATSPYTGPFRPSHALSGFAGIGQNGKWTLFIETDDPTKKGSLVQGWQLHLSSVDCPQDTRAFVTVTPAIVGPGDEVTIDASRSTSATPGTLTYEVDTGDGAGYEPAGPVTTASFTDLGPHTIRVRVTDGSSPPKSDVSAAEVVVTNPPVAKVTPMIASAGRGETVAFSAADSWDPDAASGSSGIVKYEWADDGETFAPGTPTHTVSFDHSGPHQVAVRVTDTAGATATETATLTVNNAAPVANFVPTDAMPISGQPTGFDAGASHDIDGPIVEYHWDFGDGTAPVDTAWPLVTHTFVAPQERTVTLTVTDDEGATSSMSKTLGLLTPPTAVLSASANPATTGTTATFAALGSTGSGGSSPITRYEWDLDGAGGFEQTTATPQAGQTYVNPGRLTVRLRVTDRAGHTDTTSLTLTVVAANGASAPNGGGGSGAAPGSHAPGVGGGGSDPGTSPSGALDASLTGKAIQRLKTILKSGLVVSCRASRASRCTVRLELAVRDARRLGLAGKKAKKPVVLARATGTTNGKKAQSLVLRIKRRAAAKLRRASRVKVVAVGEARADSGAKAKLLRAILVRR